MNRRRRKKVTEDIPAKANRVLHLVLLGLVLITIRVWHLGVIQHEEKLEESRKPQTRVVVDPAKRGTIRDRFNIPLAINKVQYNAAITYSQIRQIPSIKWETVDGIKVKRYKRRDYITELSHLLACELHLDPDRIEDLIHSKAALYNNLPYVIKEDISEKEYYKLKMLEKDWLGISMQCLPKRHYPLEKVGGDIIGYMGAISREQYEGIIQEIQALENCLSASDAHEEPLFPEGVASIEEAEERLHELIEHAYSVNDYVGKTGIEGKFEEHLRGYHGKKSYYSDARGNFLRELPESKAPLSGDRILLSVSSELQQYCETLLIQNEKIRIPRITGVTDAENKSLAKKHPWIKGGAIVAMDPFSGEILALASYPRFDPNDYIASGNPEISHQKNAHIHRWFESETYIGEIWDQKRSLEREIYDLEDEALTEEKVWLTWDKYLDFILPEESDVRNGFQRIKTVSDAIFIQQQVDNIMALTDQITLYPLFNLIYKQPFHQPHGKPLPAVQQEELEDLCLTHAEEFLEIKKSLDPFFEKTPHNYDKVMLIDLCRLIVDPNRVKENLFSILSQMELSTYRQNNVSWVVLEEVTQKLAKDLYREVHFKPWREENQTAFLKMKRAEEKAEGRRYAKPYLDLLDKEERERFTSFWKIYRWDIMHTFITGRSLSNDKELEPYTAFFRAWQQELLQGAHSALEWNHAYHQLHHTLRKLSDEEAIALMQSFRAFIELDRPLLGSYRHVRKEQNEQVEKHLAAAFYPIYGYGYGRSHAYRQAATQGSIFKIVTAYEALVQKYETIDTGVKNLSTLNPFIMIDDTHKKGKTIYVGYDLNGKPIPQQYKGGRIPRSHRSGIGKVDLIKAFEVSSNPYFSLLATDYIEHPNDLADAAKKFCLGTKTGIDLPAEISGRVPKDLDCNRNGLCSMAIGQHSMVVTPLQTAVMLSVIANGGKALKPKIVNMIVGKEPDHSSRVDLISTEVRNEVDLPKPIRDILLEGMYRVAKRTQLLAWGSLAQMYELYPEAISDLIEMENELLGKSSTAESVEVIDLDLNLGTNIYNHTWFGGVVYDSKNKYTNTHVFRDSYGIPELVVVVYLRYGAWGKDTVPVASQVAQKWRKIRKKHEEDLL